MVYDKDVRILVFIVWTIMFSYHVIASTFFIILSYFSEKIFLLCIKTCYTITSSFTSITQRTSGCEWLVQLAIWIVQFLEHCNNFCKWLSKLNSKTFCQNPFGVTCIMWQVLYICRTYEAMCWCLILQQISGCKSHSLALLFVLASTQLPILLHLTHFIVLCKLKCIKLALQLLF